MKIIAFWAVLAGSVLGAELAPASRQIDEILAREWKAAGVRPNKPAGDEVFLRRVYLDVIGRIPTAAEAAAFLDSKDAGKRARLIDQLLASDGYVHHFFNFWADMLRAQSQASATIWRRSLT